MKSIKKRKICVITNSRADYSRMKTLLDYLKKKEDVEILLFVVGSHLLSHYGYSVEEIKKDGFKIDYELYTEIDGRIPVTMAKSTGVTITELAGAFHNFKPDIVVIHGDRYEALASTIAASLMNIPVAHIQGGEVTGTIDEHIRHSITKLAHFHFPSSLVARDRIIRLGENPENVFNVGCPASDLLLSERVMSFEEVKSNVSKFVKNKEWIDKFDKNFILVIQHPVTTEFNQTEKGSKEIFNALKYFSNSFVIMWPNIDAGSGKIVKSIKEFARKENGRVGFFDNFPLPIFINLMRYAKVIVGNSSVGVREACYFGTPVVNIGTRQQGRERSKNVMDVNCDEHEIKSAIEKQLKHGLYPPEYLYGKGDSGKKIADILVNIDINNIQKRINF